MKKYSFLLALVLLSSLAAHAQVGLRRGSASKAIGNASNTSEFDYAAPKEYIVGGIILTGTKYLDANSLLSTTGLKEGDKVRVPGPATAEIIKKLINSGILDDVQLFVTKQEGDKIWFEVEVKERPRLMQPLFANIRKGEADALADKVKLVKGKMITDVMIKNAELGIRRFFMEKGFVLKFLI